LLGSGFLAVIHLDSICLTAITHTCSSDDETCMHHSQKQAYKDHGGTCSFWMTEDDEDEEISWPSIPLRYRFVKFPYSILPVLSPQLCMSCRIKERLNCTPAGPSIEVEGSQDVSLIRWMASRIVPMRHIYQCATDPIHPFVSPVQLQWTS
jgi:hypothetical protein